MNTWSNMLLVAGTGRNVGKTTFVCRLIEQISNQQAIIAIKVSPHIHDNDVSHCKIIHKTEGLIIVEETSVYSNKDSSRMLAAGAQKVFYIQSNGDALSKAVEILKVLIPDDIALICEAAALRELIEPGCFVLMSSNKPIVKNKHLLPLAHKHIVNFDYKITDFIFEKGKWKENK